MPKQLKSPKSKGQTKLLRRLKFILISSATGLLLLLVTYGILSLQYDLNKVGQIPERTVVYDIHDAVYSRLHGENRVTVPLSQVPKSFTQALMAREDTRFYHHLGIDFIGITRAMLRNLQSLSIREGGSTLTQQLARNSFFLGGQNLHRKLLEAMIAFRIELRYSKDEILESYVNRIYYGSGVYGLESACQLYFQKSCSELTLSESALLVGLIRSPNRFSPFHNLKASLRERDDVLDRMTNVGMISRQAADQAKTESIHLARKFHISVQENYAMDAIQRTLPLLLSPEQLDLGGLKIYTTLDPQLQTAATQALTAHLDSIEHEKGYKHPTKKNQDSPSTDLDAHTQYLQGALVAINNRTGGICAIVGGRDYRESKFNRALQARRQIGSTFKPFVYTAAFQAGLEPDTPIQDGPLQPGEITGAQPSWMPGNSDEKFLGEKPAEYGLIHSRNTMSIRIGDKAGLDTVRNLAIKAGLCNEIPRLPSIFLGGFEATPKDLTAAFTLFPNHGILKQTYLIRKIEDLEGNLLFETVPSEEKILEEDPVNTTHRILQKIFDEGTASSARKLGFDKPAGGKTGTTNNYRDAWFVGYTSSLTCGVWVGFDQPKTISTRGYGAVMALPIWVDFMSAAPDDLYPAEPMGDKSVGEKVSNFFDKIGNFFKGR